MSVGSGSGAARWALVGICSVLACGGTGLPPHERDGAGAGGDGDAGAGDVAGERSTDARSALDAPSLDGSPDASPPEGSSDGAPRDTALPDAAPPDAMDALVDQHITSCPVPTPDLLSDPMNCGSCGHSCDQVNAVTSCVLGQCTFDRCYVNSSDHCAGNAGCETPLGTAVNCAACGDPSCAIANTLVTCGSANACATAVCAPGFGNCDGAGPDCEASLAAGASCFPAYLGTAAFATQSLDAVATTFGTDGSVFVAGAFTGMVDFDPTAGEDLRVTAVPGDTDGFITKLNADGSYAWTRTFVGAGAMSLRALAASSGGAVVAVGSYSGTVDLDPGTGIDMHQTTNSIKDALAVKLAADGSLVWGKTFPGWNHSPSAEGVGVAVDAADAVYMAGSFTGDVDFDPGPDMVLGTGASTPSTMVVKLTAAGDFSWLETVGNGGCAANLSSVAVGTDGSVWGVGWAVLGGNCVLPSQPIPSAGYAALIVSYSAAGVARGLWTLEGPFVDGTLSVAAGPNASVYIGGSANGTVDLDPGPGEARRWMGGFIGGFIMNLGSDARFNWAAALPGETITSVAATVDGGVLGAGSTNPGFVTKLNGDGTSGWSFAIGQIGITPMALAARGSRFAVAGASKGYNDLDPGAAVDLVSGNVLFLSRFNF